jgi:hypothetical protein
MSSSERAELFPCRREIETVNGKLSGQIEERKQAETEKEQSLSGCKRSEGGGKF